jgi:hypothetical protein
MNLEFTAKGKNNKIAKSDHVKKLIEFYESVEGDAAKKN